MFPYRAIHDIYHKYRKRKIDLSPNDFLVQYDIEPFKFTHNYPKRKLHISTGTRFCGKMLLSYIFVRRKALKI